MNYAGYYLHHPKKQETNTMKQHTPRLHPIMLAGTGSDVGKSVLATALCRIFLQDGYHPAPFKAQNMALNSFATPDGREIGRAQATQAEACQLAPHTDMNPLLLKPNTEHTTQVVLNGQPIGNRSAYDYFRREGRDTLRKAVCEAYDRLERKYNPIVLEGAGSISELNLRDTDLVNMSMARHAGADVLLVADIDRGGVFASAYGSIMLQSPEDKKRIKGIIVNKFRGDLRLFDEGRRMLEDICQVPVLGVVPMYHDITIDEEDSMELSQKNSYAENDGRISVAIVRLPHISNFTDFGPLERDPRVNLYYTDQPDQLLRSDCIILPGTKSTLADLRTLQTSQTAQAIRQAHQNGTPVLGICGGYQMLGLTVADPDGVEGTATQVNGLGLLPIHTTMQADKVTRQVNFDFCPDEGERPQRCQGYEIHQGRTQTDTTAGHDVQPLLRFDDGTPEGCRMGSCMGTYIHGILDNPSFASMLLNQAARHAGKQLLKHNIKNESADEFHQRQYDMLADHVRRHVDMERLYHILGADD